MNKENIIENLQRHLKPEDGLYLWSEPLCREELDRDNELSDEKWEEFLVDTQDQFGDHSFDIGKELLKNWIHGW